ncbi:MAG: HAD family hydrolase [Roseovarius sp.]
MSKPENGGQLAAVLFDCDGVLVDSEVLTNQLIRDDLADHGLELSLEQTMDHFVGSTMWGVAEKAVGMGATLPDDWIPTFYAKMYDVMADKVEAVPGAADLLDRLIDVGIQVAVGSNGPVSKMDITLNKTDLMSRVSPHVYSAQDLANPKPAPDVYLHAAERLGVSPEVCIVVEDSVSGAKAAVAAGMRCIGFAAIGQQAELAPHCIFTVRSMQELGERLGV